jgi:RNA polymerase sigma factor (sigma-70 family)
MEQKEYWDLVELHLPVLKEHARKIAYYVLRNSRPGSIYTADDLLHETLIKVGKSKNAQQYDDAENGFVKVCKVAMRNIAYDLLSTVDSKRVRTVVNEFGLGSTDKPNASNNEGSCKMQNAMTSGQLTPLEILEKQDEEHAMEEAMFKLHAKHPYQAFVLLYSLDVEDNHKATGNCHAAKAQELGISHTSYRQNIHQGIKHLRRALNP